MNKRRRAGFMGPVWELTRTTAIEGLLSGPGLM